VTHLHRWTAISAAALVFVATTSSPTCADDSKDTISQSQVQQGLAASPIPPDKLNFTGKNPYLVALGSYLVNSAGDCNGCHTFPRFLRPQGTAPITGNSTANTTNQGSDPRYGNPYLDPVPTTSDGFEPLNGQLKANTNVKHFLAGGRCFGFFMSRNLTPDDSGKPRGLTEAEFIQVMRQGKDISCSKPNPPSYGGAPDPLCDPATFPKPEAPGAGVTFNPDVLQTMPWPTYHSMTDTDLKAIYAYLSALPQTAACNAAQNGCAGFSKDPRLAGPAVAVGANRYIYPNTDDCPNNIPPGQTVGSAPPQ
jgi:hypothetical protein